MSVLMQTNLPNIFHRGKVRDTYDLGSGLLLMIATDRISAFDVVLPNGIPQKGLVLARLSAFWFEKTRHIITNHLVAMVDQKDRLGQTAKHPLLTSLEPEVARRAMVVRRAQRIDIECVVRGYIAGSAWAEYTQKGTIAELPAPQGLREGDRLPEPLFTPATKAETGHDENISVATLQATVGQDLAQRLQRASLAVYNFAHDYALERGIILADTKMEFGLLDGRLMLIDELLTPDSSRFWDKKEYRPGRSQPNFDKQFVRDWLIASRWNREPPAPELPPDVVRSTSQRYVEAYRRLVGEELSAS